jgi:hypothetical protein
MLILTTILCFNIAINLPQPTDKEDKPIVHKEMILEEKLKLPIPMVIKLKK